MVFDGIECCTIIMKHISKIGYNDEAQNSFLIHTLYSFKSLKNNNYKVVIVTMLELETCEISLKLVFFVSISIILSN
jgi:hypothetical protein